MPRKAQSLEIFCTCGALTTALVVDIDLLYQSCDPDTVLNLGEGSIFPCVGEIHGPVIVERLSHDSEGGRHCLYRLPGCCLATTRRTRDAHCWT